MTFEQWLIAGILLLTLILFVWGRYRHDIVAAIALGLCVLFGLVSAENAFSGFSHPAVITVAAVLVISDALRRSGVVDMVAQKLMPYTEHPFSHILVLTAVVTVASAFMNNVGALALMLPVALATCAKHNRSPAMILMPLAFGSILGGMTTAIGTPPNNGKGTCTLCHNNLGRAPDLLVDNVVGNADLRLKNSRYQGMAKDAEGYLRESMLDA